MKKVIGTTLLILLIAGFIILQMRKEETKGQTTLKQMPTKSAPSEEPMTLQTPENSELPEVFINPVVIPEGGSADDLSTEERARIEMQQDDIFRLVNAQQLKDFKAKLAEIAEHLGLTESQQEKLLARFEALQADSNNNMEALNEVQASLSDEGLREALKKVADDEQVKAYEDFLTAKAEKQVEARARSELLHIKVIIPMDEAQQEQVVRALVDYELQAKDSNEEPVDVQALYQEALARQGDGAANPMAALSRLMKEREADAQVEALRGILSHEQLVKYRELVLTRYDGKP